MSAETNNPQQNRVAGASEGVDASSESSHISRGPVAIQVPTNETTLVSQAAAGTVIENNRGDVSASTIARMMGMATAAEFRVLEGKVDLLSTKTNSITGKLERVSSALSNVATGSDLERIDVQISSLRTALNEAVAKMDASLESAIDKLVQAAAQNVNKQGASDD